LRIKRNVLQRMTLWHLVQATTNYLNLAK